MPEDGFRKRKKRPKGWYEKAIKDGTIRDPKAPEPEPREPQPGDETVEVPTAEMKVEL